MSSPDNAVEERSMKQAGGASPTDDGSSNQWAGMDKHADSINGHGTQGDQIQNQNLTDIDSEKSQHSVQLDSEQNGE